MVKTLSMKIEKGSFYFFKTFFGMVFVIAAPGLLNYCQLNWQVLSPFVSFLVMVICFFLIIFLNKKKTPEDIDKQKITPYDYIEIYRPKLIDLILQIWDDIIKDIKASYNDRTRYAQEICSAFKNYSTLLLNDSSILKDELRYRIQKEKEDEISISYSLEYARLLFGKVESPIEVVQNVCTHLLFFIKYRTVPTDKNLNIPYNKKLRNVELINFIQDIVEMNHLEHQNYELFLKAVFPEWFTGDMTNIASNANRRVKNPLVTNEGWEINLKRLRDPSFKGEK